MKKKCSASLARREIQSKVTWRLHLTQVRVAGIKKSKPRNTNGDVDPKKGTLYASGRSMNSSSHFRNQ